jgi:hypothetical protein
MHASGAVPPMSPKASEAAAAGPTRTRSRGCNRKPARHTWDNPRRPRSAPVCPGAWNGGGQALDRGQRNGHLRHANRGASAPDRTGVEQRESMEFAATKEGEAIIVYEFTLMDRLIPDLPCGRTRVNELLYPQFIRISVSAPCVQP